MQITSNTRTDGKSKSLTLILSFYVVTVLAQLLNVFYQAQLNNESFASVLLPSLAFLSFLTLPAIFIGLKLGPQLRLGLVSHRGGKSEPLKKGLLFALITAPLLGAILLLLRWLLMPYLPAEIPAYGFRGPIGGLLVSIGAGIGEEVWFRFGLMTLLLYVLGKLKGSLSLSDRSVLLVILLDSVLFGLVHIPQLMSYGAGSNFAIWATMLGNIAVSTLYGWCYWRYGLISAIFAHISLDIALHMLPAYF